MSKTARKRIPLDVLRADEDALFGLRTIEGYQPPNENFTLPVVNAAYKRYKDTQEAEARLEKALAAAREGAAVVLGLERSPRAGRRRH